MEGKNLKWNLSAKALPLTECSHRTAAPAFLVTRAFCNTCTKELFHDQTESAYRFQYFGIWFAHLMVHLMRALITPLNWVLPINAGEGCVPWFSLSATKVVSGAGGRGSVGQSWLMCCWKKKCYLRRIFWCVAFGGNITTKGLDLENILTAQKAQVQVYLCSH